jgi:homogentisate 1,2-dioxygenase
MSSTERQYQSGYGNEFATEALAGALPRHQHSPQKPPFGLYGEQFTGTPFTAPRGANRWTWVYRIRPSAMHKPFHQIPARLIRGGPFDEVPASPNQLRWQPLPIPETPTDFVEGIATLGGNGDASLQTGAAIHFYAANSSMRDRFFYNADGELLIVPQLGRMLFHTECGIVEVAPGEICVIPRGIRFRAISARITARIFVCRSSGRSARRAWPTLGIFSLQLRRSRIAKAISV